MQDDNRGIRWIVGDWGTSNLRLWALDESMNVLDSKSSTRGAGSLSGAAEFERIFLECAGSWIDQNILVAVLCGMVGRRGGWAESPYVDCATGLMDVGSVVTVPLKTVPVNVHIMHGLKSTDPNDVMRGEETQIIGLNDARRNFSGLVCLPGTHSKWVQLLRGQVTGFHTYMTGEVFDFWMHKSTLSECLIGDWVDAEFDEGVQLGLSKGRALPELFSLRANWLVGSASSSSVSARLSGLLIGSELADVADRYQTGPVTLIGDRKLSLHYARALEMAGWESKIIAGGDLALRGLKIIAEDIGKVAHA